MDVEGSHQEVVDHMGRRFVEGRSSVHVDYEIENIFSLFLLPFLLLLILINFYFL